MKRWTMLWSMCLTLVAVLGWAGQAAAQDVIFTRVCNIPALSLPAGEHNVWAQNSLCAVLAQQGMGGPATDARLEYDFAFANLTHNQGYTVSVAEADGSHPLALCSFTVSDTINPWVWPVEGMMGIGRCRGELRSLPQSIVLTKVYLTRTP